MSGDERYSEAEREEVEKVTMEHMEVLNFKWVLSGWMLSYLLIAVYSSKS